MKKLRNNIRTLFTVSLLAALVLGCKKDSNDVLSLPRPFTPSTVTGTNGETSVTVTWPIALFTTTGQATYSVDISKDPNFGTIDYTTTTQNLGVIVDDNKLVIKQDYYARVKTMGSNGTPDSNYVVSTSFRITGEQFLIVPAATDIIDVGVQLTWKPNPDLVKVVITPFTGTPPVAGTPINVTLTATDLTATKKIVSGLTQKTSYTAEVFSATKSKGTVAFTTVASITGPTVILDSSPASLVNAIASAASGSTIVAARGAVYDMTATVTIPLNKSLTIRTALGFGTNYAMLRSGASMTFTNGSTIDSLVFRDMIIKGRQPVPTLPTPSYGAHYVINSSSVGSTVKLVKFENCTVKILRGMVRGQGGAASSAGVITTQATIFNNYVINNSVIDSIADFSIATASGGNQFQNIKITNSTFYRLRKFILHNAVPSTSVSISNCTFNEAPSNSGTNAFIDYSTFAVTNGISMTNCIIGVSWLEIATVPSPAIGYRGATTLTLTTTYVTTEGTNTPTLITGGNSYAGTSTSLFTDPTNGNFKIKDTSFAGRSTTGDPRWRIN